MDKRLREIDALVAVHVMGWRLTDSGQWTTPDQVTKRAGHRRIYEDESWSPSTDITAAWQVVEHMRSDLWTGTLEIRDQFFRWTWDDSWPEPKGEALTCTEAICLASLRAVGVNI